MRHPRRHHRRFTYRSKPFTVAKRQNEQAIILSGLNVLHVLESHAPTYLQGVLNYGPASFIGNNHAAAVIWYRRKGYPHYRRLNLFGVWVAKIDAQTQLMIGKKQLNFTASVYNAESYQTVMKQTFVPYYGNDVHPPSDANILYQTPFDITRRIALRNDLADQLAHWFKNTLFT